MTIKIIVIALMVFMLYNLFKALFLMMKNDPNQPSMSKYIGRRVMTSVLIVVLLLIGLMTGIITLNPSP